MAGIKGRLSSIDNYDTMIEALTYRMNVGMKKYNFLDKEKMNEFTFKKGDIEKELPRDTFENLRKYSEEFNAMKERNDAAKKIQTVWRSKQRGGDLSEELKKLIAKILVEYNKRGRGISEWSSVILHGISEYIMETHDEAREKRIKFLEKKFLSMDPGEETVTKYSQPDPFYTVREKDDVKVVSYAPQRVLENIGAFMAEEFSPWREDSEDAVRFDSDDEGVHRHFTNDDMEVSRPELLKAMSVLVNEGEWICDTYFAIIICHFVINMLCVVVAGTDPKLQEALNRDFNLGYTFWYDFALMGVINLPGLLGFFIYVFMGDQVNVDGRVLYKSLGVLWKHISEMNRNRPAEKDEKVDAAVARSKRQSRTAVRTAERRSKTPQPAKKDTKKAGPKGGRKRRKTRKRRKKNSKKRTKKKGRRRKSKRRRRR
jgi:hypothetical protein